MTYQEFKDYLTRYLWKVGDSQLIADLDNLIKMGESKLVRDLRIEHRHTSANIVVTNQRETLPSDYYAMRQVVDLDTKLGEFTYVSPAELEARRDRSQSQQWWPIYSLENNQILFCGPTEGGRKTTGPTPPANPQEGDLWARTTVAPGLYTWVVDPTSSQWVQLTSELAADVQDGNAKNIVIHYERKLPDFQATDSSWLVDDFLDLYTHAVLLQTAPFLREDERIQTWRSYYDDAIAELNERSAFEQQRGVYGAMPLPRNASGRKSRRNSTGARKSFKLHTQP